MLLLASNHELRLGSDLGSTLRRGRASVVDVRTRSILEALVDRLLFVLRSTSTVRRGREDLEVKSFSGASGNSGTTTRERKAFTLR